MRETLRRRAARFQPHYQSPLSNIDAVGGNNPTAMQDFTAMPVEVYGSVVSTAERDATNVNVHRLHVGFPDQQGELHTADYDKLSANEHDYQYFNWLFELSPADPYREAAISGCADGEQEGRLNIKARLFPDATSEIRVWCNLALHDRCGDGAPLVSEGTAIYSLKPTGRGPAGGAIEWEWGLAEFHVELWYEL